MRKFIVSAAAGLVASIGLLLGATAAFAQNAENHRQPLQLHQDHGDTLLVWAGDKAHEAPDFLAVVDFDRDSRHYGKILRIVPLPAKVLGAGVVGNEPHHVGLSSDGRTLALGGLLSFFAGPRSGLFL